jgi:hypothetical protein
MKDKITPSKPAFKVKTNSKVTEITGKQGYENLRNKAKAFRNIRYIKDKVTGEMKPHPLDVMRGVSINGTPYTENTTGCYGTRNTFKEFGSTIVKTGAPGKTRAPRKRKSAGNLFYGDPGVHYERTSLARVINTRHKLLVAVVFLKLTGQDIPSHWPERLDLIDKFLQARVSIDKYQTYLRKDRRIVGAMKNDTNLNVNINYKNINIDIARCLSIMNGGYKFAAYDYKKRGQIMKKWKKQKRKIKGKNICTSRTVMFRK